MRRWPCRATAFLRGSGSSHRQSRLRPEVHRISGHPPTPTTFNFYFRDGRISRIDGEADAGSWYGPFYDDFLAPEYPEFAALLDEAFTLDNPEVTREVGERLPGYFELYEEWLGQQP